MPEPHLPLPPTAAVPTADLVARHAAFVRALARRLCRSDADADDLAQDTWVEALRRPSPVFGDAADRPEGWLARVAGRLAGRHARTARRRADREALAAREDVLPRQVDGTDAALAHALVLRDVADALVALDEDARRIVVARHFEGQALPDLAAREGIATSTLKLRLEAAYERLRVRLDAHAGGDRTRWTRALIAATGGVPLVPMPAAPRATTPGPRLASGRAAAPPLVAAGATLRASLTPHTSSATLVAMGLTLKLSVVTAVGALVATGLALRGGEHASEALAPEFAEAAPDGDGAAALGGAAAGPVRTATPREAEPAPPAAPPLDADTLSDVAVVEVLVTDLDGAPAPGVQVLAAPWGAPLNRVGSTDERGAFTLRWRPGFGDPRVLVGLRTSDMIVGGLRVIEAPAGGRRMLRAALDPSLLPRAGVASFGAVRFVESRLSAEAASHLQLSARELRGRVEVNALDLLRVSTTTPAAAEVEKEPRRGPLEVDAEARQEGEVAFVSGSSDGLALVETAEQLLSRELVLSFSESSFSFVLDGAEPTAIVRGVVRDVAGLPAASVRVEARRPDVEGASPVQAVTDSEGRYELRAPLGRTTLVAGTGPNPGSRAEVVLVESDEPTCDLTLDRGLALVGVARGGDGPLAGAHVEATVTRGDELWLAVAVTDGEGRFVVPHCVAPSVDLDVCAPSSGVPVPLARYEGVGAGLEPFTAALAAKASERLVVALHDDAPGAVAVGELRVYDDRAQRVAQVPVTGEVGTPVALELPAGYWWLGAIAHGPHHGAPQRVELRASSPDAAPAPDAEQAVDVGPTAALALPAPPEGTTWRVERLLPGRAPSAVAPSIDGALAEDLEVPAGKYRVEARNAEGAVTRVFEVDLKPGERAAPPAEGG